MRRLSPVRFSPFAAVVLASTMTAACGTLLAAPAGALAATGITGTATNGSSATHDAIVGAQVCVTPKGGGSTTCTSTGSKGEYTLEGLEVKEYSVEFTGNVCIGLSCFPEYVKQVQSVTVKSGELKTLNFELLEIDGKISGRVTSGGVPVQRVDACAGFFECAVTNANGEYTIEHLEPGTYKVEFSPLPPPGCKPLECQPANYIAQYWNGALTLEAASTVTVKESTVTPSINAELQPGGHITGKVTNASIYAEPIGGVHVCSKPTRVDKEGKREGATECVYTNAGGEYAIPTLATGGYEVEFTGEVCVEAKGALKCSHPYIAQIYPGIVSVSAPGTKPGINGNLLEVSPVKPVNTGAPAVITAQTLVATAHPLLSCSTGSWANRPTTLSYGWLRNGTAIAGQTANTYTAQDADAGAALTCEVTASNAAGATGAVSNTVQILKPAPGLALFAGASVHGGTVLITLRCTGASACSGVLKIQARLTGGHGKHKRARTVTIGVTSFSMTLGKRATIAVHLTGEGRRMLAHAGRRGLRVQIAGTGVSPHAAVLRLSAKRKR